MVDASAKVRSKRRTVKKTLGKVSFKTTKRAAGIAPKARFLVKHSLRLVWHYYGVDDVDNAVALVNVFDGYGSYATFFVH